MEIDPPEDAIRGWRDFAAHMLTVTCGILIALGFEQAVVFYNSAALARHARADFAIELAGNLEKVQRAESDDTAIPASLTKLIEYGELLLRHPKDKVPEPQVGDLVRTFPLLSGAAWSSALATQGLDKLRAGESQALALAYNQQTALNDLTTKARDQWITVAGLDEDASYTDPELHAAIAQLRVATAYALSLVPLQKQVIAAYRAAQASLKR